MSIARRLPARVPAVLLRLTVALVATGHADGARADGSGWVEAFSTLRMRPGFGDPRATLADRMATARVLGRYGPESDAVATLRGALQNKPPKALRDELLHALARRGSPAARDDLTRLLAEPGMAPPALGLALAAIGDARALDALVRALGREGSAGVAHDALLRVGAPAADRLTAALGTGTAAQALPGSAASDTALAIRAAYVLAELGPPAQVARAALERALAAPDPSLRAAAATALGAIGDRRSAGPLLARLRDQPQVAQAALTALANVATQAETAALERELRAASADQRPLALRALAGADPQRAVRALTEALGSGDAAARDAALDVLQRDAPDPSWTALLATRVTGDRSAPAASALARIAGGRGLASLLAIARAHATLAPLAARALAIGLRRFGDQLAPDVRDGAVQLLRALPAGERKLLLRALARDGAVRDELDVALGSAEPRLRATAATAARMLGDRALGPAVRTALLRERDPEAARRLCEAARAFELALPWTALEARLRDPQTAPEFAALAATSLRAHPPLALRSTLRRMLSPGRDARVRVAAALALGTLGDPSAWPPLSAALDDPAARVRLAAARALAMLGGPRARDALREQARIERDPLVRSAALEGAAGVAPAGAAAGGGSLVLEAQVRTETSSPEERPVLDVLLDDGRWLRLRTLPGGELLLEDLPPGQADVRAVQ